jgi:hypothetical protein
LKSQLHSAVARQVRVERYTTGYWAQRWVGARRITPATTQTD